MGHKGPVLRPRCIGARRAQTQTLFYSMFKKHMGPHNESDLLGADSNLDYKSEHNLPLSSLLNIQFSNIKYYKNKGQYN
jgi:hypothetical protein